LEKDKKLMTFTYYVPQMESAKLKSILL